MTDLERMIRNFALQNALRYGKPNPNAVMGRVLSAEHSLRKRAREIMPIIARICQDISGLSKEEIRSELLVHAPELLEKKVKKSEAGLPELPGVRDRVMMRFAPGPSGPLHIGHSRAVILNDEYVKRYGGKLILRLEDTNPLKILMDAYEMIPEDMEWIDAKYHETVIQSDRFDIYIEHAQRLIEMGKAYVCTCPVEQWRTLKLKKKACPHRERDVEENLEDWEKMLEGDYGEGEASLIIKTELTHPNPAVRDFVGMRILNHPHPRTGKKYQVYPLYNFSVAIDDHLLGMTHVLRGKDHLNNTHKQEYIYRHFGWTPPIFIHYGWVSIPDTLLKTSSIREGIEKGEYTGWDDLRLGTFRALARRGFRPEAIRRYWIETGIKEVDIKFSWKTLIAFNKEIIDPISPRYFFVAEPVVLRINGAERLEGHAPRHPDRPEMGIRRIAIEQSEGGILLLIPKKDAQRLKSGELLRLKDLCNVRILETGAKGKMLGEYAGDDLSILKQGARNIHWCPVNGLDTIVHMPDGTQMSGKTEPGIERESSETVQFERFGFVRVEKKRSPDGKIVVEGFFAHR